MHGTQRCLRTIHASGHTIDLDLLRQLSQTLHETSLQVSWQEIAIGDSNLGNEGVTALVSAWQRDSQIVSLDLSYKNLQHNGLQTLLQWAETSEFLTKLDLSRNPDVAQELSVDWDAGFPTLQEVNLSGCNLLGESGVTLVSLFAAVPQLQVLRLDRNVLGPFLNASLAELSPSLVELSLENCGLTDEILQNLIPMLAKQQRLEMLNLSENAMTATGVAIIAKGLAKDFSQLQALNVAGNPLQGEGVTILIEQGCMLRPASQALINLDLSRTQCTPQAANLAIMSSAAQQLRLFDNSLGSQGLTQLGDCLRGGHTTMHSLDVAGNGANQDAVVTLLRGLLVADAGFESVLESVVVGGNQGGPALEELIQEIKRVRPSIDIARDRVAKTH